MENLLIVEWNKMKKLSLIFLLVLILISGCTQIKKEDSQIANPASVYCEEQGGTLEIRTNSDGSQTGYCKFEDSECEEWAFFRGECQK